MKMAAMRKIIAGKTLFQWRRSHPLLDRLMNLEETFWINRDPMRPGNKVTSTEFGWKELKAAADRLQRFAPYIAEAFPETNTYDGLIESPLQPIPHFQASLSETSGSELPGRLLLKRDDLLPIAGSVKARGGIYEVLKLAETLAVQKGMGSVQNRTESFLEKPYTDFFSRYTITVGSTGNLGLAIGIMGTKLGFRVTVHMSANAREWKKALLRQKGVTVVEHAEDYSHAVAQGRMRALGDPACHFVDDESSSDLFMGYAVAALRLQRQLARLRIPVDGRHPLFVYLPCGVGGAPGGITFGLKQVFGDHVHCLFAEPVHSPAMFIGLYTDRHDAVCVQDFGIDNRTAADGLAVGRPSGFVGRRIKHLVDGVYTVSDDSLYRMLGLLDRSEGIVMEPSALAGLPGIARWPGLADDPELLRRGVRSEQAVHIAWGTGGSMVPTAVMDDERRKGRRLLSNVRP